MSPPNQNSCTNESQCYFPSTGPATMGIWDTMACWLILHWDRVAGAILQMVNWKTPEQMVFTYMDEKALLTAKPIPTIVTNAHVFIAINIAFCFLIIVLVFTFSFIIFFSVLNTLPFSKIYRCWNWGPKLAIFASAPLCSSNIFNKLTLDLVRSFALFFCCKSMIVRK